MMDGKRLETVWHGIPNLCSETRGHLLVRTGRAFLLNGFLAQEVTTARSPAHNFAGSSYLETLGKRFSGFRTHVIEVKLEKPKKQYSSPILVKLFIRLIFCSYPRLADLCQSQA